jgi:hypothetical protein
MFGRLLAAISRGTSPAIGVGKPSEEAMAKRSEKKVPSARLAAARNAAELERMQTRLSEHHAPPLAASALAGAAAGAVAGAVGGPVSAAIGGFIGAAVGAAAGEVMEESGEAQDIHDAEVDAIIGISGGDMGARPATPG